MRSLQSQKGRSSLALASLSSTSTSSRTSRRGSEGPRSKRRSPASLEQRRQVRYLARHHPDLNFNQIVKIVDCAYSAIPKILANTFGGGDTNPDAPPRDMDFLQRFGVQDENEEAEVTVPIARRMDSSSERLACEDTTAIASAENEPERRELNSPSRDAARQQDPEPNQVAFEWVSEFFNSRSPKSLKLPTSVIQETVVAGFKKYTVSHLMRTYGSKLELSNYLATILRVTHVERDLIAGLIMEHKNRFVQVSKFENYE